MKRYVQKGFLLLVSVFLLLPMVVKADVLPYAFRVEPGELRLVEGSTVQFTLICANDSKNNLKEGTISYDAEALEYEQIMYSESDFIDDLTNPDDLKINVDTSTAGQLKYSFEKDFGKIDTYYVILTFKVKEVSDSSKVYKISSEGQYLNNSKEFRVVKAEDVENESKDEIIEDKNDNKDLINYVSYGANAILLMAVIVLAIKNKN